MAAASINVNRVAHQCLTEDAINACMGDILKCEIVSAADFAELAMVSDSTGEAVKIEATGVLEPLGLWAKKQRRKDHTGPGQTLGAAFYAGDFGDDDRVLALGVRTYPFVNAPSSDKIDRAYKRSGFFGSDGVTAMSLSADFDKCIAATKFGTRDVLNLALTAMDRCSSVSQAIAAEISKATAPVTVDAIVGSELKTLRVIGAATLGRNTVFTRIVQDGRVGNTPDPSWPSHVHNTPIVFVRERCAKVVKGKIVTDREVKVTYSNTEDIAPGPQLNLTGGSSGGLVTPYHVFMLLAATDPETGQCFVVPFDSTYAQFDAVAVKEGFAEMQRAAAVSGREYRCMHTGRVTAHEIAGTWEPQVTLGKGKVQPSNVERLLASWSIDPKNARTLVGVSYGGTPADFKIRSVVHTTSDEAMRGFFPGYVVKGDELNIVSLSGFEGRSCLFVKVAKDGKAIVMIDGAKRKIPLGNLRVAGAPAGRDAVATTFGGGLSSSVVEKVRGPSPESQQMLSLRDAHLVL